MNACLAVFPAELKAALEINGVQYKRPVTVTATVMDTVNCDTPWINAGVYTWYLAQCLVLSEIQGTEEGTNERMLSPWHLSQKKRAVLCTANIWVHFFPDSFKMALKPSATQLNSPFILS